MSRESQALYMQILAKQARAQALINIDKLAFDPQGRIVVDVKLPLTKIIEELKSELHRDISDQEGLENILGQKISPVTTVSLDISDEEDLKQTFSEIVEKALKNAGSPADEAKKLATQFMSLPKGSIIALQQELHFHLALVSRVYQTTTKLQDREQEMQAAHQSAMLRVNELVMNSLAQGLKSSLNRDGTINTAQLNKTLDKARKAIVPEAHIILLEEIARHTGEIISKADLKIKTLKKVAEKTTATPNDILHTDNNGLAVLIEGSENTAHERVKGEKFGHRQIISHKMGPDNTVVANQNLHMQIRTPSPVVKEDLDEQEYIEDASKKLKHITDKYVLKDRLTTDDTKPKAYIYNSYTAINDTLDDLTSKNRQTKSAIHILRGAHRHNARQLSNASDNPSDAVFCLVQNISVNGFGDTLGYDSSNTLVQESTLMAELAMLHTISDSISANSSTVVRKNGKPNLEPVKADVQKEKIKEVFELYKRFLNTPERKSFFAESAEGQQAIQLISELKADWRAEINFSPTAGIMANAKLGLKNIMANNLHWRHENAKIVQALCVFSEEVSLGGCKSGNERAQAINGRVALLDDLLNKDEKDAQETEVVHHLATLAKSGNQITVSNIAALRKSLDRLYNERGLQSAMSLISLVDQGGPAKVEAKPRGVYVSRNYAEEKVDSIDNLYQKNSSRFQAHKELTSMMLKATEGNLRSWWARMKSTPLGIVGAIAGTVFVFPAAYILIDTYLSNKEKVAAVSISRMEAAKQYRPSTPEVSPGLAGLGSRNDENFDDEEQSNNGLREKGKEKAQKPTKEMDQGSSLALLESDSDSDHKGPEFS
ncbi:MULTISPECIES: hypothetical protein [Legionella]|uniref:Uncharacterized protein n=1 Tax=Legionella drozanskii LLAP-1 TaxID=1212489 RepID=A0A0W0SWD2_9GAMM|nr:MULTISPECIES: hypothetical protein [Legionella]KTC87580.1 hypothetical protein Ldro_1199 [Legionella drozanskii LLAP-1]PJE11391.1 MAG: hypothetical protein CK430_08965 [Legionella sp.]